MTQKHPTVESLRQDTPGADRVIHFNNAGCALPVAPVVLAQTDYIAQESVEGGYEAAERLSDQGASPYLGLARLLQVHQDEVGFCGNATDAWRRVLYALALPHGARIAFDESIYGGNLLALIEGRDRFQWVLRPVRLEGTGTLDLGELERQLADGVDLVAITHIPAQSGAVNPVAEISAMSRRYGALCLGRARDWLRERGANVMFAGPQNAPLEMFRFSDQGRLRASLHYYNTEDEILRFAELIGECHRAL